MAALGRGAEVLPIRLWVHCGEFHARDGRLAGYTDAEIERFAGWWGEKGRAIEALCRVGYLVKTGDEYACADWLEHQGHIDALKTRNRNAANARWEEYRRKNKGRGRNAARNANALQRQSPIPPSFQTVPTLQTPRSKGGGGGRKSGGVGAGGRGSEGKRVLGVAAPAGWSGRFQWPGPLEVPVPLFHEKAEAMLADCDAAITEIEKAGLEHQGAKDALGNPIKTLLPEAKAAKKAWLERKLDVRKARSA